jgi:hypothetical protein
MSKDRFPCRILVRCPEHGTTWREYARKHLCGAILDGPPHVCREICVRDKVAEREEIEEGRRRRGERS